MSSSASLTTSILCLCLFGCSNTLVPNGILSQVSEQAYLDYIDLKYNSFAITNKTNGIESLSIINKVQASNIINTCKYELRIVNKDVTHAKTILKNDKYVLSDSNNVDKSNFHNCIQNELSKIELKPKQLNTLMNLPQYKIMNATKYEPFEKKIDEIKTNGKFTILDGLEIVKIIDDYEIKQSALNYKASIENL